MAKNLEQRVAELEKKVRELSGKKTLALSKKFSVGDEFELLGLKWKILSIAENGYKCLAEKLEENMQFGSNNDWKGSHIRKYLNGEFLEKLSAEVGEENIIPFERNLLSLDGQTEYGVCEDKVSLLTFDEYRENRALIPNANYWWWLITPDSTACNGDETWVRVVSPSGYFDFNYFNYDSGVRPVCIFSSSIFESEE